MGVLKSELKNVWMFLKWETKMDLATGWMDTCTVVSSLLQIDICDKYGY